MSAGAPADLPEELCQAIRAGAGLADLRVRETIRRPGSVLWRVDAEDRSGRTRGLIVKLGTRQRAEDALAGRLVDRARREFETLAWLHRTLPRDRGISVPEPLLCLDDRPGLVLVECPGQTLGALVLGARRSPHAAARLVAAFDKVGRAAALIQEQGGALDEPLDLEHLLAYDELRLARLERTKSIAPALAAALRAESRRLVGLVPEGEARQAVVTHGDLCPGNILLDGESIVLLDFAMVGRGSIYQDLSYCHEHLERTLVRHRGRPPRALIRRLQAALLAGFSPSAAIDDPLFRLGQIRHHLNFLVNTHEPSTGLRRIVRRFDRARGLWGLRRWLAGRGVSPVGARS
jgi:Ser/Thr protein kinase RdoA (MazF antagonist)